MPTSFPRLLALAVLAILAAGIIIVTAALVLRPVLVQVVRVAAVPTETVPVPTLERTFVPTATHVPPTATFTATFTPSITPTPTDTPTITPTVPTPTPEPPTAVPPTATAVPVRVSLPGNRCVSVVGDSVAAGDVVYEMPGVGYLTAHLTPISRVLEVQLASRGIRDLPVLNRSAAAVGISSGNHPSYFNSQQYAALMGDACQYTVIIPWINDLTGWTDAGTASVTHANALTNLVQSIAAKNPGGRIFVINYYQGAPQPFAAGNFASGFTPSMVSAFNAQIAAACNSGTLLIPAVRCLDANTAFSGMGFSHLAGQNTPDEIRQALISPLSGEEEGMLNAYAATGGLVQGDGVHLSGAGKVALASYVAQFIK